MKALFLFLFPVFCVAMLSATTSATPPTVTTLGGSGSSTSAIFSGEANPNGDATTAWFRYSTVDPGGCSDTFGTRAPASGGSSLGSGTSPAGYYQQVSGVPPAPTTFYFCAIAQNSSGIGFGDVLSFTSQQTATMATLPATELTGYSATLNGSVNPNGAYTQVYFRYSSFSANACSDGTLVPQTPLLISGTSPVPFSYHINGGLAPGFTYYFCAIGLNIAGNSYGGQQSFTTTNELPTVSGTVTYGNAIGAPSPRFVSNVSISISNVVGGSTTTAAPGPNEGRYSIPAWSFAFCFNTAAKTGGVNGISSNDAGRVAQHVSGINTLTGNQLVVADVSGDGTISSFDAAQIARYAAGLGSQTGSTGTWRFTPENYLYHGISGNYAGQDFVALLMGEVTGNWTNTGSLIKK